MKYKLGAVIAAMILIVAGAGYAATKLGEKSTKTTSSTTITTGGQPVAIVAGAAMAYAYNLAGSGYSIGQLVKCTGTGPAYSCVVVLTDQTGQKVCGKIDFTLDTAGALALKNGTQLPSARCGG